MRETTPAPKKVKYTKLDYRQLFLLEVELIFNNLRNYQNLIEDFLLSKKKQLEESFDYPDKIERTKDEQEYYQYIFETYANEHHEIARLFPHNFRSSLLSLICASVEEELKKICNHCGSFKGQTFEVNHLKGQDDIRKCKEYLEIVSGVNMSEISSQWQFILNSKKLRNAVVHHGSTVKSDNQNLLTFIETLQSVELKGKSYNGQSLFEFTIVHKNFLDKLIDEGESFFKQLLSKNLYDD